MNVIAKFAICAAFGAAALTTPALAGTQAARVSYSDLNLATAEGQAELQVRLDDAARQVCRYDARGQIVTPDQENACFRATSADNEVRVAQIAQQQIRFAEAAKKDQPAG